MKKLVSEVESYILENLSEDYHATMTYLVDLEAQECAEQISQQLNEGFVSDYVEFLKCYCKLSFSIYGSDLLDARTVASSLQQHPRANFWSEENNDEFTFFDLRIKKENLLDYGYPSRIQIATNEMFYLFMDLEPSDKGKKGQIIFKERDGLEEIVVADSFGNLLNDFITDLRSEHYVFEDFMAFYAPDGDVDLSPIDRYADFVPEEFLEINNHS